MHGDAKGSDDARAVPDRSHAHVANPCVHRSPVGICYINALLQQLFMIPALRHNLLAVDLTESCATEQDQADSVVYQLQRMMSYLQESGE